MVGLDGGLAGPQGLKYQLAHWNEDRSPLIISTISTLYAITSIAVILRLAARRKQRLSLQWDDYLMMIALVDSPPGLDHAPLIGLEIMATGLLAEALLGKFLAHPRFLDLTC